MKPLIADPMHGVTTLAGISQAEMNIGLGAAIGAVAGGLIGGVAGNPLLGAFIGASLIAFAMRPRFGWRPFKG